MTSMIRMSKNPDPHGWKLGKERAVTLLVLNEQGKALNINEVIDTLHAEGWLHSELQLSRMVRDAVSLARKNAGVFVSGSSANAIHPHKGGRVERLNARFTKQEKDEIMAAAHAAGLSASDFILTHQSLKHS